MENLAEQLCRARKQGGAFLIPSRLLLRLSGADAFRYLNGQITRDLSRLDKNQAAAACILTPKGKLCATLRIHREGEELVIESDPSLEEILLLRLERYLVADEVSMAVESTRPVIHLFGELSLRELQGGAPGIHCERLGVPGIDLDLAAVDLNAFSLLDPRVVEVLRIERGIPAWGSELGEETLPPEAGLDRTHIDYDRGCYPGQEVISRLKSIGRVNRLLCRLKAPSGSMLHAGMTLLTEEGKEVGSITSAALQFDTGSPIALGYLSRVTMEEGKSLFAFDPLTGEKTPLSITQITGS